MTTFTKDELDVISNALDIMVRTEGQGMANGGIGVLKGDVVLMLSRKLKLGVSALEKVGQMKAAITEAEQQAAAPEGGG